MKIYKYHIRLYKLYEFFGDTSFCSGELEKIIHPTPIGFLYQKGLLERTSRKYAENSRPEVKKWKNCNWHFNKFSKKGLEICTFFVENPNILAKKLLTDFSQGKTSL